MNIIHRSDVGRVRVINEDRAVVSELENGYYVAIVADGMGGHQAGHIASQIAVETVIEQLSTLASNLEDSILSYELEKAILYANEKIFQIASQDVKYHRMGTTIVVALFNQLQWKGYIGYIGDSRAYVISQHTITQLTDDHTLVNELVKCGELQPKEAEHHPRRNVLMRALGTDEQVKVDLLPIIIHPNEVLLLCSDGLTNMLHAHEIKEIIVDHSLTFSNKADRLLKCALTAGGDDNITFILLDRFTRDCMEEGRSS